MAIDGKKIAKNTGMLYFRMLLMLFVSLYTSRILLATIGVEDYGIYNVVGGVVVMIGFLSATMGTTSSRYITVALGHGDISEMKKTFSSILLVNFVLALILCLFAETVGLWFFYEKMVIPEGRRIAALWVYQVSVIVTALSLVTVPFNAAIIAHEKMNAFAFISLFDAFARLGIVYLLMVATIDKLILYAILMALIQLVNFAVYVIYCLKKFEEVRLRVTYDRAIVKSVFGFIVWSSYGSLATVGFTQGLNIILNLFFGPVVNAARGVAVQVQNAVVNFTHNFQTALNPQLIKLTAQENFADARKLLIASSKYSFFLLCFLGLPIIIEAPFILGIWLKEVPEYSVSFCRIILITSIFGSLANPLRVVNQAEGNIKKFQLYECTLLLTIMPISYFALKLWQIPILVFFVHLVIELIAQIIRIIIVVPKIEMTFSTYAKEVYARILPAFFLPLLVSYLVFRLMPAGILSFFTVLSVLELILCALVFFIGLTKPERNYVVNLVKRIGVKSKVR